MFPPAFYSTNPTQKTTPFFRQALDFHGVIWGSNSCGMLRSITSAWGSYQVGATFLNVFNEIERNIRAIICLGWVRNQQNWEDIVMMIIWNCVQALLIVYTVLLSPMSCKAKNLPKIHHKKPSFPYVFSTNLVGTHVMLIQRESPRSLNQKEQYWWTHLEPLHFFYFSSCHSSPFLSESIGRHPLVIGHDLIICSCVRVGWRRWRSLSLMLG